MRLNWFLPARRKAGVGDRAAPGVMRRALGRLGPTWLASPWRRVVQAGCMLSFLGLFFYVCWPYTARPARTWHGWLPDEIDPETGKVVAVTEQTLPDPLCRGTVLYVSEADTGEHVSLGAFQVAAAGQKKLVLEPIKPLAPEQLDKLSVSLGPWSLHETEPGSWPSHYADDLQAKEKLPAESFLALAPLVSVSAALAAGSWVHSLKFAGVILVICLVVPRGFCGYVCPMGTLIDLFDWALGKRVGRLRIGTDGWWVHVKYCLLLATLTASVLGVLISGFVAAIPLMTRAMAFLLTPLQTGAERGWHQVPPFGGGQVLSAACFVAILGLGLLRPRFWCRYVCPTGAVFSIGNLFRLSQRKVQSSCIGCHRCVEICPFDAIKHDYTTRATDCTFCQECGGVCPVGAIQFVTRWSKVEVQAAKEPPTGETHLGRRGFLAAGVGGLAGCLEGAAAAGAARLGGARLDDPHTPRPVRPPGSVPERKFLRMCTRCGECFQACPNDVLQPLGFQQGIEGLWTPQVAADWSGCEASCNNCGQVCPTGAIRALPLSEKRAARMGLAIVNQATCLPHAGHEACRLCVDECTRAGYEAIEFVRVGTEADDWGNPIEGTGFLAPVVLPEKCVGCGLCQTRCFAVNVVAKRLLKETAIRIEAGEGKEDRLTSGSYVAVRRQEQRQREQRRRRLLGQNGSDNGYLPDFIK